MREPLVNGVEPFAPFLPRPYRRTRRGNMTAQKEGHQLVTGGLKGRRKVCINVPMIHRASTQFNPHTPYPIPFGAERFDRPVASTNGDIGPPLSHPVTH